MHALTKFFVVLSALFCIALSVLTLAYAANTDRIRQDFASERSLRLAAEAQNNTSGALSSNEMNRLNRRIAELTDALAGKDSDVNKLKLDNANLLTEKASAERDRDSYKLKIDEFAAQIKTVQNLFEKQNNELNQFRQSDLAMRTQRAELEDKINDLTAKLEIITQNKRAIEEQLAEAKNALNTARAGGGVAASASQADQPFVATQLINGRVNKVQAEQASGKMLVTLSVGQNNGVQKNMKFFVGRGTSWIANVVVIQSDLKESVAVVEEVGPEWRTVREGDMVTSRLSQ